VQEDCSTCHVAHGSVADHLLTANEPTICLQCHDFHFHSGYQGSDELEVEVGGFERENPFGPQGFNIAFTTNCTQCHSRVHGSDLPSQTVPGMGRGLTQ
jgi:predicted CXXCH cytochrome family protein